MVSSEVARLLRRAWSLRGLYLEQMTAVCAVSVLSLVDLLALKWLLDSVIPWS